MKLGELFKSERVRKYLVPAMAYAAGAYGGAPAGNAVREHGPMVLDVIAKILGG